MPIEFASVSDAAALAALAPAWEELLTAFGNEQAMYQSPQWFSALLKSDGVNLALAVLRDDGGAVRGLCPIELRRVEIGFNVKGSSRAVRRFLTATVLGGAPLWGGPDPELARQFVRAVFEHFPAVDGVHVSDTSPRSPFRLALEASHERLGLDYFRGNFHALPMPEALADHLKRFSSKRKYNYRREQRLLEEVAGGPLVEYRACSEPEVQVALDRVEAASRVCASDVESRFLGVVERHLREGLVAARAGLLRSALFSSGSRITAFVLAYQFGSRVHVHAIDKNPELLDYSPGSLAVHLFGLSVYAADTLGRPQPTDVMYGFGGANVAHLPNNIIEPWGKFLLLRPSARNWLFWLTFRAIERATRLYHRVRLA